MRFSPLNPLSSRQAPQLASVLPDLRALVAPSPPPSPGQPAESEPDSSWGGTPAGWLLENPDLVGGF